MSCRGNHIVRMSIPIPIEKNGLKYRKNKVVLNYFHLLKVGKVGKAETLRALETLSTI